MKFNLAFAYTLLGLVSLETIPLSEKTLLKA